MLLQQIQYLNSHGFETGDVRHTSDHPSAGLDSEKIYYVVKVDRNTIKLSNTLTDSKKINKIIGISASYGTINPINPKIDLYKNSVVTFDLSDDSLAYVNKVLYILHLLTYMVQTLLYMEYFRI